MKKTIEINHYVKIIPTALGDYGCMSIPDSWACQGGTAEISAEYRRRCEQIADDVKRHVNHVQRVQVVCDTVEVCEYCGAEWAVEGNVYNGCCDADTADWQANHDCERVGLTW